MTMNKYWLGIDAGGSRSTIIAVDDNDTLIHKVVGPSIHAGRLSPSESAKRVAQLVADILSDLDQATPVGLGIGLAGAGRDSIQKQVTNELERQLPSIPLVVASDAETSYLATFKDEPGILIICGTGSIAMGKDNEGWKRAGGYGYQIGDPGSGYQLGQKFLFHACEYYTSNNRFPYPLEVDDYELKTLEQLLEYLYVYKNTPARFAPHFLKAIEYGDQQLLEILEHELLTLTQQVKALTLNINDFSGKFTLSGSICGHPVFQDKLKTHIHNVIPDVTWADWVEEPAYGSCYLIRDYLHNTTDHGYRW